MAKRLLDKVAIVTGSSSGLGRAISLAYARQGARVICSDLGPTARAEKPEETGIPTHELITEQGGKSIFVSCDVGNSGEMKQLVHEAVGWGGRLDVIVNNAGISIESKKPAEIQDTADEVYDTTMLINSKSVFLGCKYAAQHMVKQEPHASGDRGWIINLGSIAGLIGLRQAPSYAASKGAVVQLTRQIAVDLAKYRIHCNAICPGFVGTAIFKNTIKNWEGTPDEAADSISRSHPFGGLGRPEDIANAAVFLASEDASWVTGVPLPVDGGYVAV
ncbi:MAG: hypothetical protein M1827_006154 [Pycnora praestabilis]|nr:MAG: hypothetical protein M1827_006154 [Pycnora praestabilis]